MKADLRSEPPASHGIPLNTNHPRALSLTVAMRAAAALMAMISARSADATPPPTGSAHEQPDRLDFAEVSESTDPPGPEPLRLGLGLKIGWLNQLDAPDLFTVNLEADLRVKTWALGSKDHWVQLQLPQSLYWITTDNGGVFAVDTRVRAEWGPSLGGWLPGFGIDVGWLALSEDFAASGEDRPVGAFMVGGVVRFPIRRVQGIVHLKFGKALSAVDYSKFSCGLRFYPFEHVGFHIHGDNFWRDLGDHTAKYSGFFGGVTTRW